MELDELYLQSGNDIPFGVAQITIHQPRIKEIGFIGEEDFHIGCHFLVFDRKYLSDKDKSGLENLDDFDIFMSVMNSSNKARHKTDAIMVLALLFPEYKVKIEHDKILLQLENFSSSINKSNFSFFRTILKQIFCLEIEGEDEYNPEDGLAAKIAEKLKKRHKKLAEEKGTNTFTSIFSKYISILSVGLQKDKNELLNYTIYQLKDEFTRFITKYNYDMYFQAKLAGAKDLEEVQNWID